MKYKFISLFLTIVLSLSFTIPAMAADADSKKQDNSHGIWGVEESNAPAAANYLWKATFKATKWGLVKINNALFYRDPIVNDSGGNWVSSSSGSVSFGNGTDDVRRVKFTTTVSTSHNRLNVFAQTSVLGWLDTITIFIENSSGTEVYGGQVTHNQHIYTDFNLPLNTYTTYYVCSNNRKWDCWIYRYDYTDDYSRSIDLCDMTASNMIYNPDTQKSYIIPSDNFIPNSRNTRNETILTAQDLVNEFYDTKLNCSVNNLKNYDVGDVIYVNDLITDLKYDDDTDVTTIYFGNTADGSFSWPFAGDLRSQFNVNDELTFKFNIVEEYATNEYTFETLDYFLESYSLITDGLAVDIEDYLVR